MSDNSDMKPQSDRHRTTAGCGGCWWREGDRCYLPPVERREGGRSDKLATTRCADFKGKRDSVLGQLCRRSDIPMTITGEAIDNDAAKGLSNLVTPRLIGGDIDRARKILRALVADAECRPGYPLDAAQIRAVQALETQYAKAVNGRGDAARVLELEQTLAGVRTDVRSIGDAFNAAKAVHAARTDDLEAENADLLDRNRQLEADNERPSVLGGVVAKVRASGYCAVTIDDLDSEVHPAGAAARYAAQLQTLTMYREFIDRVIDRDAELTLTASERAAFAAIEDAVARDTLDVSDRDEISRTMLFLGGLVRRAYMGRPDLGAQTSTRDSALAEVYSDLVRIIEHSKCHGGWDDESYESDKAPGDCQCNQCKLCRLSDRLLEARRSS